MSSSTSLTGGKYTRDLKLRVLEHYFRNGGDVFGNKQSTAKKFGVDSKTINRFLKIPELVRAARKNAKASKAASGSSGGFKEPLVPGTSGVGRTRPPQRQSVRITLPTQPDESIVSQSADGSTSSIGKLLKIFELGTQEIRDLLAAECDLIYECRVCRALFRSVANLLAHKRRYCTRPAAETRHVFGSGPGQSLAAPSDGVMVLPLPATIDRLPEVRQAAAEEARAAVAQPVPAVRLEALPGSDVAVLQTVGEPELSVGQRLEEVNKMTAAAGRTVRLGRDGRVVESDAEDDGEETEEPDQAEGEDGRHVCQHCNTTFSTRKTLSHHVRSLHSSTRIYYPCCLCSAAFINMFSVERHLQKVHKKKQDEIDVLKEGIKQKSFHRSVTEPQSAASSANPNMPIKVTSFEWKCRQCSRRYLSLPVGLQHVQSVHPQFSSARAGLVRVCRIIRQPAESGAVSTRSSSGAVTPADLERPGVPRDDDPEVEGDHSGDSEGRMLFNKANLLKRLSNGGERCVLCRKVFTGHLQACGHLRLHDQRQIEAYLGQKVRLIRKRRPVDAQAEPEEYELDGVSAATPPDEEQESDADAEPVTGSPDDAIAEPAEDAAGEPPTSVEARGFPVQMVAAERVRRRHFVHTLPGGEYVCTLCDARFPRWPAARAHLARHSRAEVARYVARHAVDGLVGVPAAIAMRPEREAETAEPAETEEMEEVKGAMEAEEAHGEEGDEEEEEKEGGEDEENEDEEEEMDAEVEGETASVDTDIAAGAKLLVSCKLWSPGKRKQTSAAEERQRDEPDEDAIEEGEDGAERDSVPLTQELDGEMVDKWEAIRRKGSRLRCVVCNKTFMKSGYAEVHLRTEHTFREIRDFISSWRLKGVRSAPRVTGLEDEEAAGSDAEELEEDTSPPRLQPAVEAKPKTNVRPVEQGKGAKRTAETAPAAPPSKVAKREPAVLNVPAVKTPRDLARSHVGPIGPNTKILKISRSDLLQKRKDGLRICLVCDLQFDSHPSACEHMRQHSDEDIRNFIKTRGREFLPAFEQRQKQKALMRRASEGAGSASTAPTAAATMKPARSLSLEASDKSVGRSAVGAASSTESSKPAAAASAVSPAAEKTPSETKSPLVEKPDPQLFHRDEAVCEFELFDKAQLLKRQPDGTKCLLCTRVFAKHSSACGHLSHHGAAEVQAWRTRMRRKASALLKLARRPRAYSGAEAERSASPAAAETEGKFPDDSAMETDSPTEKEAEEDESKTNAENEGPKKGKGDGSAKTAKADVADPTPVRVTRRKDSIPAKVTRADNVNVEKDSKRSDESAQAVKADPSSPVKVVDADKTQASTKTFQVSGTRGTGRLVKVTEMMKARLVKSAPDQTGNTIQKNIVELAKAAASSAAPKKTPESSAKAAADHPTPEQSPDNNLTRTPSQAPTPSTSATKSAQSVAAVAAAVRAAVSPAGVTLSPGSGVTPVRATQLVKLPQAVKLALLQSADGTIQTAGGRTIMRLAPGVKLPLTAASLPRVLRPIAPKGTADGEAGAVPVLQPPLAGAVTSPGSPPRPRPPPLLRAPLLQTMSRAGGGSITVHVPALRTATSLPVGTTVTAAALSGARAAAKSDGRTDTAATAGSKTDTKTAVELPTETGAKTGGKGKGDGGKTDDATCDKTEGNEKRPTEDAQLKKTAAGAGTAAETEVKGQPEVSAEGVKSTRRQGESKSSQTKSPSATPPESGRRVEPAVRSSQRKVVTAVENPSDRPITTAAPTAAAPRPGVVTKRAFIPEVPGKPATRCSWTPEPSNKASPRAAAASASAESSGKGSPAAPAPGEVPQTRARAEAAVAARMRQTRRSSTVSEKK